jgi:integrase
MGNRLGEIRRGEPVINDDRSVGTFLEQWLAETAKVKVRPSTFVSYEGIIRLHLLPDLGKIQLRKLAPGHIQRILNRKLRQGLSPRRVQYVHAVLRHALNHAVRWQIISRNPATLVDTPRVPVKEVEPLSAEQALNLLEAARGDRLEALYTVALSLGLRQGEALGLRWQDVELDRAQLHVRGALQRVDGAFTFVEPKTRRSRRTLALPGPVVGKLREHRAKQIQDRLLAGGKWQESGLIFTSRTGRPLDGTNVTTSFQRLLARAGLPRKRFYDLRHSCATLLLVQGVPARVVMEILGHSQIGLTLNTYTHVLPELQLEAARRMGDFLRSGSSPKNGEWDRESER